MHIRNTRLNVTFLLAAALSVGACNDTGSTPPAKKPAATQGADAGAMAALPMGETRDVEFEIDGKNNTIEVMFGKGMGDVPANVAYTATTPPMPFRINNLQVYQVGNQYRLYEKNSGLDVRVGDTTQPTKFTFDTNAGTTNVTVNGQPVGRFDLGMTRKQTAYINYNGAKRVWNGEFVGLTVDGKPLVGG